MRRFCLDAAPVSVAATAAGADWRLTNDDSHMRKGRAYRIGAGGLVAIDVHQYLVRLRLASQGLPKGGLVGFEVLDTQKLGVSQFAEQINSLKQRLLALAQFEKKIRIMADIEKRPDSGNLFGIGGSIPQNMDPKAAFGEQRSSLFREMHDQTGQLDLALVHQGDSFKELVTHLERQQRLLASTPTIRPIDPAAESWVSSRFEWRLSPFTNQREFHKGYDIAARDGTPIYATAGGVVTFSGNKGLLGKTIIIDHGHGLTTVYGHCSRLLKAQGEKVGRWDSIAMVGNTGSSTGPHLHYEVWVHGVPVNPEKYFLN